MNSSILSSVCAVAASMLLGTAWSRAQQPFQLPTSLGRVVASSGNVTVSVAEPLQMVGTTVLCRRTRTVAGVPTNELGIYSTEAWQGPLAYSAFFTGALANSIADPVLERGGQQTTRLFFTQVGPTGARQLRSSLGSVIGPALVTLPNSPPRNWQLKAVSRTNTVFVFHDTSSGEVSRFDAATNSYASVGTVFGADGFSLSPNGQRLVVRQWSGPFTPSAVLTVPIGGGGFTTQFTGIVRSVPVWLDDRFLCIGEQVGGQSRLRRIDTQAPASVEFLTSAPVSLETTGDLAISDDHQWLTFLCRQNVLGASERVPVAMRVASSALSPSNGPGGSLVVLGNYRWLATAPASTNLTDWFFLGAPKISSYTTGTGAGAVPQVRVVFHGALQFGQPPEVMRADVIDDPMFVSRGVMGTTVEVTTIRPPFGAVWGLFGSFDRFGAQVPLTPDFWNALLINNPIALFTVVPTTTQPSGTFAVPLAPSLTGINLIAQGVWLTSPGNPIHFSHVAQYSLF